MRQIHAEAISQSFQLAIVTSRFNEDVTQPLFDGAVSRLQELGIRSEDMTAAWVPGAIEIPLVAQHFAELETISAVICLGAVIKGETDHYDFVCQQVNYGCQRLALDHNKPIVFGVLTTENLTQALDRVGGKHGHYGRYCADTAYEMVSVIRQIA